MVLDLSGISTFTDFFVICSGTSEPQLKAIANEIETRLREDHSLRPVAIDGFPASQWIVLDYLQVVVHIFHRDKRAFYSLEDLWGDAPRLEWETAAAHGRQAESIHADQAAALTYRKNERRAFVPNRTAKSP